VSRGSPPQADELEVSIIGPGRGECVLVHLGNNEWCVIDSCFARGAREPVAIEYLRGLGNDALRNVKLIVATHWHDDHINGLAAILREVPDADFACSAALGTDQFATLLEIARESVQSNSGVEEFKAILDLLVDRGKAAGTQKKLVAPQLAVQNRSLLHLPMLGRSFSATVTALSPSDGTVKKAFADIAAWLPKVGEAQRRIPNHAPNQTSVALWITAGSRRVLLGADLEHTNNQGEGWMAVLARHQDAKTAAVFKVPHHGSRNADCPEVWEKMLIGNPLSVVTPFTGGSGLPQPGDLRRLLGRTNALYCTAQGPGQLPRRDAIVERFARATSSGRRVIEGRPGHVRVRFSATDEAAQPSVEIFNGAHRVH
jgi:Metallo-beta-lactamase superfamily